ncbi:short-chain dehydrogenase [Mycena vitilis]|nr:short-chain dehydrogenase [Mycena vitilis]
MSLPSFSDTTTADEVATTFANEIQGKNVLVTGTSVGGIGFETARVLAKHANLVIITGHNAERMKIAEEAIKSEVPSANTRPLMVDLSSLASVRKAAAEVNAYPEPLHILINNAAGGSWEFKLTEDNIVSQMATSHVGPFLLTKLLTPKLLAARTAQYTPRVVFVSSEAQAAGSGVNFDSLASPDPASYEPMQMYGEVKAANVLTALELSKRSKGQINGYSLHPGLIFTNSTRREGVSDVLQKIGVLTVDKQPNTNLPWKTLGQGAATTLVAALDPRLDDKAGAYLVDCVVANGAVAPQSSNPANAEKLWSLTESVIGEPFVF